MANNESITIKSGNPSLLIESAGSPDLAYISVTNTSSLLIGPLAGTVNNAASNLFVGYNAGHANTTGAKNTFLGRDAGKTNTTSSENVYIGYNSGIVATGQFNCFCGSQSGSALTTGFQNTGFGFGAGGTITTGSQNTCIGDGADCLYANLTNCIAIGSNVECEESGQVLIGGSYTTDYYFCADIPNSGNDVHFNAARGAGNDTAGFSFYLSAGKGIGNAAPGSLFFQTSTATVSGATVQTLSTRLKIDGVGLATFYNGVNLDSLTASTVAYLNASKTFVSLANASGVLTNNGSGSLSWVSGGAGTVTSIATTSPISGGTITTTGTISLLVNVDHVFTAAQSVTAAGLAVTSADGVSIINSTASTGGATVQMSPRVRWLSHVWNTSADITHEWWAEVLPTSAATPTSLWKLQFSNNGGGATSPFTLSNAGVGTFLSTVSAVSYTSTLTNGAGFTQSANSASVINSLTVSNSSANAAAGVAVQFSNNAVSPHSRLQLNSSALTTYAGASSLNLITVTSAPIGIGTNSVLRVTIPALGGLVVGIAALATTATDGFLYIPTCAGAPTGVPTTQTGTVAMIYDTTNNKFYIYNAGWKGGTAPGVFS
jgi:hypothetical protein